MFRQYRRSLARAHPKWRKSRLALIVAGSIVENSELEDREESMAVTATVEIPGVQIRETEGHDDGSSIMRWNAYRGSDAEWFAGYGDALCGTLRKGAVWPFHYHKSGVDTFGVIYGTARIVLYDMREDSPTYGKTQELVLNGDGAKAPFVRVPPLVAHAFEGMSDVSVLVDLPSTEEVASSDFFFNEPDTVPLLQ